MYLMIIRLKSSVLNNDIKVEFKGPIDFWVELKALGLGQIGPVNRKVL